MNVIYNIIYNDKTHADENKKYGIEMRDAECGRVVEVIQGIASRREELDELVALMNELELEPIHFNDVIEDFLYNPA